MVQTCHRCLSLIKFQKFIGRHIQCFCNTEKCVQADCLQARGISINKLAAMSNIKQSTVDNIMRGISKNPTIQTLHKISLSFGMTLAEFLDYPELNEFSFDDNTPENRSPVSYSAIVELFTPIFFASCA